MLNKSDIEKQIPYNFTYMQNLKNKKRKRKEKHNRNKLIDTVKKDGYQTERGLAGRVKKLKG